MRLNDTADYFLSKINDKGSDRAQCDAILTEKHELNVNNDTVSLLRTTYDTEFHFSMIKDQKQGSVRVNKSDTGAIDRAIDDICDIADAAHPDPAYDISDKQAPKQFQSGEDRPDLDAMHRRLSDLLGETKKRHPKLIIEEAIFDFTHQERCLRNSNHVHFSSSTGVYHFWAMFTAKDGKKTSSFNYTGFSLTGLEKELLECGALDTVMRQTNAQLDLTSIPEKFVGDVIISPDCLKNFIGFFVSTFLSDHALISGTSIYKESLNTTITDPRFTLHSKPVSKTLAGGYFITSDGFEAKNSTLIQRGRLAGFNLSLYGANKTGFQRAVNNGGYYIIDTGVISYRECIQNIKKGIMLCRFSGGVPSSSGAFSGVAKNSYYIENGEIKYPLIETMISGNLADMFNPVTAISAERINFGNALLPWIVVSGITISGR